MVRHHPTGSANRFELPVQRLTSVRADLRSYPKRIFGLPYKEVLTTAILILTQRKALGQCLYFVVLTRSILAIAIMDDIINWIDSRNGSGLGTYVNERTINGLEQWQKKREDRLLVNVVKVKMFLSAYIVAGNRRHNTETNGQAFETHMSCCEIIQSDDDVNENNKANCKTLVCGPWKH